MSYSFSIKTLSTEQKYSQIFRKKLMSYKFFTFKMFLIFYFDVIIIIRALKSTAVGVFIKFNTESNEKGT